MQDKNKIPRATAKRLALYYRSLKILHDKGVKRVSSSEIADELKLDSASIRRDFSFFGELGKRGYGYDVDKLLEFFSEILHVESTINVGLVGVGNLGRALVNYEFGDQNALEIVAAFDSNKTKIDKPINNIPVYSIDKLADQIKNDNISVMIMAVPADQAQGVADDIVAAGIRGILNFTSIRPSVPANVRVQNVDLSTELHSLSYFVRNYDNILSNDRRGA